MTTETMPWQCPDGRSHHWLLPVPNGPELDGRCKFCDERRTYPTTTPDTPWDPKGAAWRKGIKAAKGMYAGWNNVPMQRSE